MQFKRQLRSHLALLTNTPSIWFALHQVFPKLINSESAVRRSYVPHQACPMPHAPRPTPHAPRPTPHAPRPTPHAPRPMPHALLPVRCVDRPGRWAGVPSACCVPSGWALPVCCDVTAPGRGSPSYSWKHSTTAGVNFRCFSGFAKSVLWLRTYFEKFLLKSPIGMLLPSWL